MLHRVVVTIVCLLAASSSLAGETDPDAKAGEPAFLASLEQVQAKMDAGDWEPALASLRLALSTHAERDYVLSRRGEILDAWRRCAVRIAVPEPDPQSLITGEIVRFNPKTGQITLRYTPQQMGDFRRTNSLYVHPASFAGQYSIEFEDVVYATALTKPVALVCIYGDEWIQAEFGRRSQFRSSTTKKRRVTYKTSELKHCRGKSEPEVLDEDAKPTNDGTGPHNLKVTVSRTQVSAQIAGRTVLRGKKRADLWGSFGFAHIRSLKSIEIRGTINSSWLRGLADKKMQAADQKFFTTYNIHEELPEWFRAALQSSSSAAPRSPSSAVPIADASFGVDLILALAGSREAAITHIRNMVEGSPTNPLLNAQLALLLLRAGRPEEATKSLDRAARVGGDHPWLEMARTIVAKQQRGPSFTRSFRHETRHFEIVSDIDRKTCEDAGKILEQAFAKFDDQLPSLPEGLERSRVYIFSGEAGYLRYISEVLGGKPHSTAGIFSPTLKQLLIWNVPDRGDMLKTIRHEGLHQYLDALGADPPRWFNEGLAEYYEHSKIYHRSNTIQEGQIHELHLRNLWNKFFLDEWLTLDDFVRTTPKTFMANASLHYSQAWALVHFLQKSTEDNQKIFDRILQGSIDGLGHEECIARAFEGVDTRELGFEFRNYIRQLLRELDR